MICLPFLAVSVIEVLASARSQLHLIQKSRNRIRTQPICLIRWRHNQSGSHTIGLFLLHV